MTSREASDPSHRRYHVVMLLHELAKKTWNKGDTREYLSVDIPEGEILRELLEGEAKRLRHHPHPALGSLE